MTKLLFTYINNNNKKVDVVMDPRELTHMEFVRGERTHYVVYKTEEAFNEQVEILTNKLDK
jgi:hypothetical protein